jgi:hypothetical protein
MMMMPYIQGTYCRLIAMHVVKKMAKLRVNWSRNEVRNNEMTKMSEPYVHCESAEGA